MAVRIGWGPHHTDYAFGTRAPCCTVGSLVPRTLEPHGHETCWWSVVQRDKAITE